MRVLTLSARSQTIEYFWGRECPNLKGAGFVALSRMPALKGLAVSCKFVDDAALASLPDFPSLKELMPMDVSDDGFRHIGRSKQLESLILMYCRDTTDVATSHIVGMPNLKKYHAGYTLITDASLEMLGRIKSLEEISFEGCKFIYRRGHSLSNHPAPSSRDLDRRLPESNAIRNDRVCKQRASQLRPVLKCVDAQRG